MKNATMLYKIGTELEFHGTTYDTIVVDSEAEDFNSYLKDGWYMHPNDIDNSAPTREELETKCTELKIPFDGRTSNKTMEAKIKEALSVVD